MPTMITLQPSHPIYLSLPFVDEFNFLLENVNRETNKQTNKEIQTCWFFEAKLSFILARFYLKANGKKRWWLFNTKPSVVKLKHFEKNTTNAFEREMSQICRAFINYSFRFYGAVKMKAKGHCFFTLSIVTQFPATSINNVGLTFSIFEIQFIFEMSFSKSNIVNRYCSHRQCTHIVEKGGTPRTTTKKK